jgi:TM2 domain-containing membrane protein YozV
MAEIIEVNGQVVKIGGDNGQIITVPIASVGFANPQVGDEVKVYKDDKEITVRLAQSTAQNSGSYNAAEKKMNKNVFVWVGTFLFGGLGVDRFMRGQIGVGICKLLFGWLTLGIWGLVDWIVALTKAYGGAFGNGEEITFINGKYAR